MYGILEIACVASFWLKVPMLLAIRIRSSAPWWFVIASATALGWMLSNAHALLEQNAACCSLSKPYAGLLYGPLYLLCCSVPYWLIFSRRSACGLTPIMAALAGAALLIEWSGIIGDSMNRGYLEKLVADANLFIWPPATIAAAFVFAWIASNLIARSRARRHLGPDA